jgi:hypothetical protein
MRLSTPAILLLVIAAHSGTTKGQSPASSGSQPGVKRGTVTFDKTGRFQDDFGSSSLERWQLSEDDRYGLDRNTPSRIDIVPAPGLPGMKAVRFFVPREINRFRAEISLRSERGYQERWYSQRLLVRDEWVPELDEPGNDIVMQWHGVPGNWKPTFPNLEISIGGDHWHVRQSHGAARAPVRSRNKLEVQVVPGKWTFWVVHAKWSPTDAGLLRIWKDHELVFERKGPNVYGDIGVEYTPYFKTGIYHPEWKAGKMTPERFAAIQGKALSKTIHVADIRMADPRGRYRDMVPEDLQSGIPRGLK